MGVSIFWGEINPLIRGVDFSELYRLPQALAALQPGQATCVEGRLSQGPPGIAMSGPGGGTEAGSAAGAVPTVATVLRQNGKAPANICLRY